MVILFLGTKIGFVYIYLVKCKLYSRACLSMTMKIYCIFLGNIRLFLTFSLLFTYIKYILICQTIDINSRWIIEACAPFENIILQKPCFYSPRRCKKKLLHYIKMIEQTLLDIIINPIKMN